MKDFTRQLMLLLTLFVLQGCAVYAVYGLYQTVSEINTTLTRVDSSIARIERVLKEGKDLHRAAEDGELITTLAEKIPTLIQQEVEIATKEKITALAGDLSLASRLFTTTANEENLPGAQQAFADITATSDTFSNLMTELSESFPQPQN